MPIFIQSHYIAVTVTTPSVEVLEPTNVNLALIVGPVVGGLLFVVIMVTVVACLTCCVIHHNKKMKVKEEFELKEKSRK
jgi:hypothetical protein